MGSRIVIVKRSSGSSEVSSSATWFVGASLLSGLGEHFDLYKLLLNAHFLIELL
jgi:hypothetical protein